MEDFQIRKTYKEAYHDLLHILREFAMLKEVGMFQRRKCDGYFASLSERIDNIVLQAPKEDSNESD